MSGKKSRDKGGRVEREFVNNLVKHGIEAKRVPLSGACDGFKGDIKLWLHNCGFCELMEYTAEVKARKNAAGFKMVKQWLGDNDILFLKEDYAPPLVVMGWSVFMSICDGKENKDACKKES